MSISLLLLALPAQAWNATGHRVIAAIAYDRLTPAVRAKIDAMLARHPDYATLLTAEAPPDPAGRARAAFLAASVWPDVIKSDNRFYDDTRANARPTPLLAGFPSMARHTDWHYVDEPFSPDGTPLKPPKSPNALEQLRRIIRQIGPADASGPYDLPWLIHIEGDVHQPLHTTSRFLKTLPDGDQGGNLVFVDPGRNLHAVWDDLLGTDASDATVSRLAREIGEAQKPGRLSLDPRRWVQEGFRLAQAEVYTFGSEAGSREHPLTLPKDYTDQAKRFARDRVWIAGLRLAALLNRQFK